MSSCTCVSKLTPATLGMGTLHILPQQGELLALPCHWQRSYPCHRGHHVGPNSGLPGQGRDAHVHRYDRNPPPRKQSLAGSWHQQSGPWPFCSVQMLKLDVSR